MFSCAGVPVSIQWDAQGYFYAIQVCQFGLSHYSKNLTHREPRVKIYEDAENEDLEKWSLADQMSRISAVRDETTGSNVIEFQTTGNPLHSGTVHLLVITLKTVSIKTHLVRSNGELLIV